MADEGNLDKAKGRAKEAMGDLTDDESLQGEGKVDRAAGGTKGAVSGIADRIKSLFRRA
jgi:uncharacterized protein YjbJ (UPF0337 family)